MTVTPTKQAPAVTDRVNPYVGPRAFRRDETLPNREREARDLTDLVAGERIVLLHSPSGAGKTSLIQSAVMRLLAEDDFRVFGPARVGKPPPRDFPVGNRYVYSLAVYLLGRQRSDPRRLAFHTLDQVLDQMLANALPAPAEKESPILIIDQFEEILMLDPTDWDQKAEFFKAMGAALTERGLWVLFAMREDFMGGLDRYRQLLPGHLRARYRLDFLTLAEARQAIQRPAAWRQVRFTDDGAEALVDELARTRVSQPDSSCEWQRAPYVEPFHLQVVCRTLWEETGSRHGPDFTTIDVGDVERVDIEDALSRYYSESVAEICRKVGAPEQVVRDWFETHLITPQQFRSPTMTGPVPGPKGERLLRQLQKVHLVRSDTRAQTTWYELEHDRFISPVITNNEVWRRTHLASWQTYAHAWERTGRPKALLLARSDLPSRSSAPPSSGDLTPAERDFLHESREAAQHAGRLASTRNLLEASAVLNLLLVLVLVVVLVVVLGK